MKYSLIIVSSVLFQLSSAQIFQNVQRAVGVPNNGISNIGVPINSNLLARNVPVGNLAANNLANTNFIASNLASTNLGPNLVSTGNVVNANLLGNNLATIGANVLNTNLVGQGNLVTAGVPINLANGFNLNTGRFAETNTGLAKILNLPCGLQIVGDRLEVGGSVGVNGQLPFYTTISAKGQLPSSGYGYASCGCGGR